MQLSRRGYFADFYVYPAVAAGFIAAAIVRAPSRWESTCSAVVVGIASWTLAEYLLHRYILHHLPWVKEMHDAHHKDQKALIGTPTYLTLIFMLGAVTVPSVLLAGAPIGCGFTAGMMLGYLWYVATHYGLHNWKVRPKGYFSRLRRRHALHHHYDELGNFGVTSGFWDYIFGTNITPELIATAPGGQPG